MRIEGPRSNGIRAYQQRQTGGGKAAAGDSAAASVARTSTDIAIAGIPESELTPRVQQAILTLMAEVGRLRDELHRRDKRLEELERLADEDPLTAVFNRRAFVREVTRFSDYADRYDTPSSILFFDVNGMKTINDTHGHGAGDKALVMVADALRTQVRSTDVVGRLGGDEFGVLLVNTDADDAPSRGQRLAQAVQEQHFLMGETKVRVSVAWGWHTIEPGVDVGEALRAADAKMYRHKRGQTAA
ncbi:MAG: GGDEF domain-containing protein [Alphaproteobacteria bacterium]